MALTKISTGGVKDDAISSGKIPADAVGQSEIADEAVDEARLQVSNAGSNGQFLQKQSGNTGGLTWATVTVPDADKIEEGNTSIETTDTGSDGHVKIKTEGTTRVLVDNTGRVGIGFQSFNDGAEQLLVGSTTTAANISIVADNSSHSSLNLGDEDDFNVQKIRSDHTNNSLQFFTDNNEKFRFGSSGQLGVGGATYGTSGQVLTSGGASAAPTWADAGGFWTNLHQGSYTFNSSSDSESITGLGSYDMLRIYMMVSATGNSLANPFPRITIGTSSGMKDDNYQSETTSSVQSSAGGQAPYWPHTQPNNFGNPGGDYGAGILTGEIFIANWQGTSYHTIGHFSGGYTSGTNQRLADYSGSIAHRDVANYDRIALQFAAASAQNTALLKITIQGATYS